MAGLSAQSPYPTEIKYHQNSRLLEIKFSTEKIFIFTCEFLRVYSPSAEVRGHGHPVLQTGKKEVAIVSIEPVGNYAIRLLFSDKHDTGIYSWDYLYDLGEKQVFYWEDYLKRLETAGASRDV